MFRDRCENAVGFFQKNRYILLASFWTAGLLLGVFQAVFSFPCTKDYLCIANIGILTWPGLAVVLVLPLGLCFVCVFLSKTFLLLPILFLKSYSFGFCSFLLLAAFRSAGWLVGILLLITDYSALLLLLWFSVSRISGSKASLLRDTVICLGVTSALGALEYLIVSPLFQTLLC